jgi:serine protease AprX
MGGTSSAAPHVGAAVLLMQDAGITDPVAEKALIINSADAWTDNNRAGPYDLNQSNRGEHYAVMGSEWNRTYGWGYINLQKAFDERLNVLQGQLTIDAPQKEYVATLSVGSKVTLVHERRVGYLADNTEWKLSHLSLEIYDAKTLQLIARDDSAIDTVHQVANCDRQLGDKVCSDKSKEVNVLIRVRLLSDSLDGANSEPFAIAASVPLTEKS